MIKMIGNLPKPVLDATLETIPIEFSIVDENDDVLTQNRHKTRIFKRPKGVVGKNVRKCHPKRSVDKVEVILKEMKKEQEIKHAFGLIYLLMVLNKK